VKIGDFGITKRAEEGFGASSTLKGTLGFLAPELIGFVDAVNESSSWDAQAADMWSLGEIAFQMLTGETTFKNMRLLSDYVNTPGNFPSHLLLTRGVSSIGRDFIKDIMMPTPEERLTAKNALLHDWMKPYTPPDLRPSFTIFNRYKEFSIQMLITSSNWG
jgi:serine/threonine protein kinase